MGEFTSRESSLLGSDKSAFLAGRIVTMNTLSKSPEQSTTGTSSSKLVKRSVSMSATINSCAKRANGNPLSYFSFQPVLHDWCNKGRGVYYNMHIKEPLLLIDKYSLTICLTPYNRR